jgi:hypothetical protein
VLSQFPVVLLEALIDLSDLSSRALFGPYLLHRREIWNQNESMKEVKGELSTWKNTEIDCIKPDWCVHAFCGLAVILVDRSSSIYLNASGRT